MDGRMKTDFANEHSSCRAVVNPELPEHMHERVREIVRVWTDKDHRGEGYATQLMQEVCNDADSSNMVLILRPQPFDANISKAKLIEFYKRFGFSKMQDDPVLMARAPTFKVLPTMIGDAIRIAHGT